MSTRRVPTKIDLPGVVLGVRYVPAKIVAKQKIPDHIHLHAFLRHKPLTGDPNDMLNYMTPVGSYWGDGRSGEVCLGPASRAVFYGGMSPEDAFWSTTFSAPQVFFKPSGNYKTSVGRIEKGYPNSYDPTHWAMSRF